MATEATTGVVPRESERGPARIFMAVSAVFHIPIGLIGLAVNQSFPIGSEAASASESAYILGVLETNGWHSLAALLVGLISLYFAVRPERAREGALSIGISHIAVFICLAVSDSSTFWLASNAADQVIHATTAITGTGAGLLTRSVGSTASLPA